MRAKEGLVSQHAASIWVKSGLKAGEKDLGNWLGEEPLPFRDGLSTGSQTRKPETGGHLLAYGDKEKEGTVVQATKSGRRGTAPKKKTNQKGFFVETQKKRT